MYHNLISTASFIAFNEGGQKRVTAALLAIQN